MRADTAQWGEYAARGEAAAHLRSGDAAGARHALLLYSPATAEAEKTVARYAATPNKIPWVGGVMGLIPGLGYAYSGEYANALRSLILNSLFIWAMVETAQEDQWALFSVATFFELTWYTGSIYGGIDAAHRHNQSRLDQAVQTIRGETQILPDEKTLPLISLQFQF
jgi:hypothetical protein